MLKHTFWAKLIDSVLWQRLFARAKGKCVATYVTGPEKTGLIYM